MTQNLLLLDAPSIGTSALHQLRELRGPGSTLHVVVPAGRLDAGERTFTALESDPNEVGDAPEVVAARWRLRDAITRLQEDGFETTGEVGEEDPIDAIEQCVSSQRYDTVAVVTGPAGIAGWVNLDLPSRVRRHVDAPVLAIECDPETVA